jgi:hypothetical protein
MKLEISEKDKKLLVFLTMFVIIVCIGYWGIYPVIKSIGEIKNNIEDEEYTRDMNELKVAQLPVYEMDNEQLEADIVTAKSNYYKMMTNDEIDKYFTELVMGYGLLSYDLTISNTGKVADLSPYQYSQKAKEEQAAAEAAAITASLEGTDETEDGEDSGDSTSSILDDVSTSIGIYSVKVTMRLGGEEDKLVKFIDDMSISDQKLRVCSYSWSGERNVEYDEDGDYSVSLDRTLNIVIEIYMCEE